MVRIAVGDRSALDPISMKELFHRASKAMDGTVVTVTANYGDGTKASKQCVLKLDPETWVFHAVEKQTAHRRKYSNKMGRRNPSCVPSAVSKRIFYAQSGPFYALSISTIHAAFGSGSPGEHTADSAAPSIREK